MLLRPKASLAIALVCFVPHEGSYCYAAERKQLVHHLLPEEFWPKNMETTLEMMVNKKIPMKKLTAAEEKAMVAAKLHPKGAPSKHLVMGGMCWRNVAFSMQLFLFPDGLSSDYGHQQPTSSSHQCFTLVFCALWHVTLLVFFWLKLPPQLRYAQLSDAGEVERAISGDVVFSRILRYCAKYPPEAVGRYTHKSMQIGTNIF